jgi:hypothetical protein
MDGKDDKVLISGEGPLNAGVEKLRPDGLDY